ncbi:AAA domain-containing protein, partial [Methanosarcina sp. 1.H.T.1A.1]|uniref:AAA domain-containing protein n=1 Tax=Methanosarcina sp. 1.H.T.1A.1 TaxID=1483602 RepID=UPI00064E41C3
RLVGSEMCIRDSSRTVYHDLGGIKTPEFIGKRPGPFEEEIITGFKNPFARKVINKAPICWADSSGTMQWINFESSHSAKNDREIENISKLLELLVEDSGIDPKTIGVLSPFRYQASTMVKALENFIEKGVAVNTIHSFQGNEKDIIIISMVARHTKDSRIFEDIRLLNVAITRTKFKLIVVSDTSISESKDRASLIMDMLYDSARKNGGYVAKDGLNPTQNDEIRKDTLKEQTIADAQQYITKERKKLGLFGKY